MVTFTFQRRLLALKSLKIVQPSASGLREFSPKTVKTLSSTQSYKERSSSQSGSSEVASTERVEFLVGSHLYSEMEPKYKELSLCKQRY